MSDPQPTDLIPIHYVLATQGGYAFPRAMRTGSKSLQGYQPLMAPDTTAVRAFTVLPWVTGVQWQLQAAVAVTPTMAQIVVESAGYRIGQVQIVGEVGYANLVTQGTSGNGVIEHPTVQYLRDVFTMLQDAAKTGQRLRLYGITEGLAWEVVPQTWITPRQNANRMGISYQITLQVVGVVAFDLQTPQETTPQRQARERAWYERAQDALNTARDAIAKAQEALRKVQAVVDRATMAIYTIQGAVQDIAHLVQTGIGLLYAPARTVQRVLDTVYQIQTQSVSIAYSLIRLWRSAFGFADLHYGPRSPESIPRPLSATDPQRLAFVDVLNLLDVAPNMAGTMWDAAIRTVRPYEIHRVASGESLAHISLRYYGSTDGETDILDANEALRTYGLIPGMTLVIPKRGRQTEEVITAPSPEEGERAPENRDYGRDLRLADGDLVLDAAGDLALVDGRDALLQSLLVRLSTQRGTNPFYPRLGLSVQPGSALTADRAADLAISARETVLADDRVTAIRSLALSDGGNGLVLDIGVDSHGEALRVSWGV